MSGSAGKRWRAPTPMETYRETQAEDSRQAERLRMEGWPVVRGSPEECALRHQRALQQAQLAEHRRNRGLA